MERIETPPRADWRARVEALGFDFHTIDAEAYWDETAHWVFTEAEADVLDAAAAELHRLHLEAAAHAVAHDRLGDLGLPESVHDLVRESWYRYRAGQGEGALYGRFDLSWAGEGGEPPKLLEYNADTPTALFEAAVVQWQWLEDVAPGADQFNAIHEQLVERWAQIRPVDAAGEDVPLHLASVVPHKEDEGTVRYLAATAMEAGLRTKVLPIDGVGLGPDGGFVDQDDQPIAWLFKLYPWEWLLREAFAAPLAAAVSAGRLVMVEPAWKLLLTGKGMLALLWELFPDHPNLLPAHRRADAFAAGTEVVAKPMFGREGANVSLAVLGPDGAPAGPPLIQTEGPYGSEGYVFQAWHPIAAAADAQGIKHHAVLGLWVVGDAPCGLGVREDFSPITRNTSRFVPHLIR